ncbi:MAG: DNA polymerase III subunit alpha [Gammaproteobacteria bacterium]|nr:DNA polymerase III subunit alpha [Gammaproteobacteria bacterium]
MTASFVHLRLHTEYSLIDGTVRIEPLMQSLRSAGMGAVALTDQCNLFAMVKFYRAATQAGIKPIIGVDVWIRRSGNAAPGRLVLLCQNERGYRNLTRLVTRSYTEGQQQGAPTLQKEWLAGASEGLIALSGGHAGDIGQALLAQQHTQAEALLQEWLGLFPERFYLEVSRAGREGEEDCLHATVQLALDTQTPVVATNDVRFLARDDFEAHEARACIHEGRILADPRRPRHYTEQQYLRSPEEMAELFADLPEALENTVEIARRCNLSLRLGENYMPDFPVPDGVTLEHHLRVEAERGLQLRIAVLLEAVTVPANDYQVRLATELDVINRMGFAGYFLIVADFIRWAKDNGIPVGPGRGSGAGSLVAYVLGITDVDPIYHGLLFERFLNPERVSLPDFDIDFCMERRDEVIDYVARRYGRERVSQIITYGSMAAKAVVRDVGRVLGLPYGYVDTIAKLIPFELGITLERALKQEPALRERCENEDEARTLLDLARKLEGITRNAGKHAGGLVIAPSALTDFTPLYCEQGAEVCVTQFDKDDIEAVGLVKFDFLGLRTLTIIDWTVKNLRQRGVEVDIARLALDDKAAFELLKSCATSAVFQLESRGMRDLIKRLQPDRFDEIVALVALFRPGPLQSGMVDDFINRKHGKARVDYPHPDLMPILKPTYGVILYQEQVMQIAQVLAGYTLGAADMLRRAMGKKKPAEMAKQRDIFMQGAAKHGVRPAAATHIFDLMEKFADYGFNKSHSVAYALIAYQTAWLKAHYPAAFMAAVLSADMDNTDKIVALMDECRAMNLTIVPPDINRCDHAFTVHDDSALLYGLGAIKGVGAAAIEGVLENRSKAGKFVDLFDFCRRIDMRKANRRVLEALIRSGALDVLGPGRATLFATLPLALNAAEHELRDRIAGQDDLFGTGARRTSETLQFVSVDEWTEGERLQHEKETLGLYLTGHPVERYREELASIVSCVLADIRPMQGQSVIVGGLVVALRVMNNRRGERMAFITLDDRTARVEIAVFSDVYQHHRELLAKDKLLVIEGEVSLDEYTGNYKMSALHITDINQARERHARRLVIDLEPLQGDIGIAAQLSELLEPFRNGGCPVWINYSNAYNGSRIDADLALGEEWRVHPTDELLHRLEGLVGKDHVKVVYNHPTA